MWTAADFARGPPSLGPSTTFRPSGYRPVVNCTSVTVRFPVSEIAITSIVYNTPGFRNSPGTLKLVASPGRSTVSAVPSFSSSTASRSVSASALMAACKRA